MHIAPSSNSPKKSLKQKQSKLPPQSKSQDGSRLLSPDFPPEALNWTTSFLLPEDLCNLNLVSQHLHSHVALDATWRSAFLRYTFGLDPEAEFDREKQILLKRTCNTWKEEYIVRIRTTKRWQTSKAQTVSHSPHHSVGYPIHWSPKVSGLLSASTTYGVVSRSSPATGATIKGFLDAQGITNGAGIGNPNVEFSPDVSAVDLTANGGKAYVAWGYRSGRVAFTFAPNFMELTDKHRTFRRCEPREAHDAQVSHIVFCDKTMSFVSGAWDGTVKLWSADPLRLLWESGKNENAVASNACMKVAYDSASGTVVAASANGIVRVWTGLAAGTASGTRLLRPSSSEIIHPLGAPPNKLPWEADPITLSVSVSSQHITILHHCNKDPHINRIVVPRAIAGSPIEITRAILNDGPLGSLTSTALSDGIAIQTNTTSFPMISSPTPITSPLAAFAATIQDAPATVETGFVAAGDILGRVCIWDLNSVSVVDSQGVPTVKSLKRFQAHDDGAVSTITLSSHIWATGSTRGTVRIWDSISFTLLRTVETPCPRPTAGAPWPKVEQIIIDTEKDIFLASVGSWILYWKPGNAVSPKKGKGKARLALGPARPIAERWHREMEIKNALQHTQDLLNAERRGVVHAHRRHVEQNDALTALGLDETEAVEYALMLSRDQEEERRLSEALSTGPFEEYANQHATTDEPSSPPLSPTSSTLSKVSSPSTPTSASLPRSLSRPAPISFYSSHYANPNPARVQVSPSLPPEPIEAGFTVTPLSGSPVETRSGHTTRADSNSPPSLDAGVFPKISPKSLAKKQSFTSGTSSRDSRRSTGGQSVWSRPMTPKATQGTSGPSNLTSRRPPQPGRQQRLVLPANDVDEDLEFAIRLSLAEAQSQKEWDAGKN